MRIMQITCCLLLTFSFAFTCTSTTVYSANNPDDNSTIKNLIECYLDNITDAQNINFIEKLLSSAVYKDSALIIHLACGVPTSPKDHFKKDTDIAKGNLPALSVNGSPPRYVQSEELQSVHDSNNVANMDAPEKKNVSTYLSYHIQNNKNPAIYFSICNLMESTAFDGHFSIFLLQAYRFPNNVKGWIIKNKIANQPVSKLPPSQEKGCTLPDVFNVPNLEHEKEYAVIGIVYDTDSHVRAINLQQLPALSHINSLNTP